MGCNFWSSCVWEMNVPTLLLAKEGVWGGGVVEGCIPCVTLPTVLPTNPPLLGSLLWKDASPNFFVSGIKISPPKSGDISAVTTSRPQIEKRGRQMAQLQPLSSHKSCYCFVSCANLKRCFIFCKGLWRVNWTIFQHYDRQHLGIIYFCSLPFLLPFFLISPERLVLNKG